ncbi:MAG: hypothetical protein WC308_04015 [archaeon]|jgi:hypothetical protein
MKGTKRKQRNPTVARRSGTDFESISEIKNNSEHALLRNKMRHYTPKKKVILLPGTVLDTSGKNESKEKG